MIPTVFNDDADRIAILKRFNNLTNRTAAKRQFLQMMKSRPHSGSAARARVRDDTQGKKKAELQEFLSEDLKALVREGALTVAQALMMCDDISERASKVQRSSPSRASPKPQSQSAGRSQQKSIISYFSKSH